MILKTEDIHQLSLMVERIICVNKCFYFVCNGFRKISGKTRCLCLPRPRRHLHLCSCDTPVPSAVLRGDPCDGDASITLWKALYTLSAALSSGAPASSPSFRDQSSGEESPRQWGPHSRARRPHYLACTPVLPPSAQPWGPCSCPSAFGPLHGVRSLPPSAPWRLRRDRPLARRLCHLVHIVQDAEMELQPFQEIASLFCEQRASL